MSTELKKEKTDITQVQVKKATRKRLKIFKAQMEFNTYDEVIKFLLDDFAGKTEEEIEASLQKFTM
ncbi:MAG: hypothetical protein ACFFCS_27470 [Candidatus Hodarchaeota archaeon]